MPLPRPFFSTATGVILTADYLTKGFLSDNAKKGVKFAKEKAGDAFAFYGLLKSGDKLNAFANVSASNPEKIKPAEKIMFSPLTKSSPLLRITAFT